MLFQDCREIYVHSGSSFFLWLPENYTVHLRGLDCESSPSIRLIFTYHYENFFFACCTSPPAIAYFFTEFRYLEIWRYYWFHASFRAYFRCLGWKDICHGRKCRRSVLSVESP